MSWIAVARKDFRDAARARSLWILSALFVILVAGIAYAFATILATTGATGGEVSTLGFIGLLQSPAGLFISIAGILVSYRSIAGERESGSIKLLLGLPNTRTDVIVGKVIGRSLTVMVPLLVGFGLATIINLSLYTEVLIGELVLFTALTLLYAFVFTGVGVGLSSAFASTSHAAAAGIGFWFLNQIWGALALVLNLVASDGPAGEPTPDWILVFRGLSPGSAYGNAAAFFLPEALKRQLQTAFGSLPEWYGVVVLLLWAVLGLWFGYTRFQSADL